MNNEKQFEEEKKEVPTPPPSQANVRTMQSDLKSLQESGGQAPQPYSIEIDQAPTAPLPPSPKQVLIPEPLKLKTKKTKILFIILAILILGIALAFALIGYYNKKTSTPSPAPALTPAPAPTPPLIPAATSTSETISSEEIIISPLTLENFKNILKAAAANAPLNDLKKLVLRNEDRSLINFSDLLPLILPELNKEEIARFFSENFSLAVWVDKNGSWPVFVVQIKPTAALIGAQTFIKEKIETSTQRANLHYGWVKDKLIISTSASGYSAILEKIK